MTLTEVLALAGEFAALVGAILAFLCKVSKLTEGQRCQLRVEMLRIYYANRDAGTIRQFELENFIALYDAYRALKGNSFIEKVFREVMTWKVIP